MSAGARKDPYLLTPGPLTTSPETKQAMLRDLGARDRPFIEMCARIRARLTEIAGAADGHDCVLVQGSGTFAVEAAVGTLVPRTGKLMVLANGTYGRRIAKIAQAIGRTFTVIETPEDAPLATGQVDRALAADPKISHVAAVHLETSSGLMNPIEDIAATVARHGRRLLIDAMSTFGGIELDARVLPFEAIIASANKCLEGVPGAAFVIARREALAEAAGNAPSLSLDLHDQWRYMAETGQFRFTPPTHVLAALDRALEEHAAEGGVRARGARYRRNREVLVEGMRALGFETYLEDALLSPIIVAFHMPGDPRFDFTTFYEALSRRGFVIYPGKLAQAETFRIGCIGRIGEREIRAALAAVAEAVEELGIEERGRRSSATRPRRTPRCPA